jgi:F-box/leucine-rich repeat protein 2/20
MAEAADEAPPRSAAERVVESGLLPQVLSWVDVVQGARSASASAAFSAAWTALSTSRARTLDLRNLRAPHVALRALTAHCKGRVGALHLEFCKHITDADCQGVRGATTLRLNALHGPGVTEAGLCRVPCRHPDLTSLSLYWMPGVGDRLVQEVAASCPLLTRLNLSGTNTGDAGVRAVAANCKRITDLNLTRCFATTDAALEAVCGSLPRLRRLEMFATSGFSDPAYRRLTALRSLDYLGLCGARNVTSETVAAVVDACPRLVHVDLTWCVLLDDAAVLALAAKAETGLEFLSLYGLQKVSHAAFDALAARHRDSIKLIDVTGMKLIPREDRTEAALRRLFPNAEAFDVPSTA